MLFVTQIQPNDRLSLAYTVFYKLELMTWKWDSSYKVWIPLILLKFVSGSTRPA